MRLGFNRTTVECKWIRSKPFKRLHISFNRTTVECKYGFFGIGVPVNPVLIELQ